MSGITRPRTTLSRLLLVGLLTIAALGAPSLSGPASASMPDPAPVDPAPGSEQADPAPADPAAQSAPVDSGNLGNSTCTDTTDPAGCTNSAAPGVGAAAPAAGGTSGNSFSEGDRDNIGEQFMRNISDGLINAAIGDVNDPRGGALGYVIDELIGRQGANFNPIVTCNDSEAAPADCKPWFVEQLGIMRTLGLWMITPLVMLAMIQAVLRGSLFLVMRAAAIMLPVAVLGTIAIAFFTQLLLNISDDLAAAMFTFGGSDFADLREGIAAYNGETTSVFGILFTIVALVSALVIILEMILREIGVYLTVLFMPLAFAALVWPVSASWTRSLIRLLVGLIFSKVFIAGGIALGLAAIENGGTVGLETQGLMAVANAGAIFIIAAIFGIRMLDWTPGGSDAKQARIAEPTTAFSKGDVTNTLLGDLENRRNRSRRNYAASGARSRGNLS